MQICKKWYNNNNISQYETLTYSNEVDFNKPCIRKILKYTFTMIHTQKLYQYDKWHCLWHTKAASVINLRYRHVLDSKSVSQPPSTPPEPALVSINLMMPPSDLRWTQGMSPFEHLGVRRQSVWPASGPRLQVLYNGWPYITQEWTHTVARRSIHTCQFLHTHKPVTHGNISDKQLTELNLTACQMRMTVGFIFDWIQEHNLWVKVLTTGFKDNGFIVSKYTQAGTFTAWKPLNVLKLTSLI